MTADRFAWIAWFAVMSMAAWALVVPRFGVPRIHPGFNPSSISIQPPQYVVQTFRARVRGVDSIDLRVEKASQAGSASVAVEFVRQGQGTARRSERVALADLAGSRWWRVRFAPIEGSQDGVYSIRIDVEGAPGEARLVLATTEGHEYPDGELSVDGGREPLDLVMNVDARHATAWRALHALLAERYGWGGWIWVIASCYGGLILLILLGLVRSQPSPPVQASR